MNKPRNPKSRSALDRHGAAVVEAALILPVLVVLTLSAIDIAQYVNLTQSVTNASREGARLVSRNENDSVSEVEIAIRSYLQDSLPNMSAAQIANAMTITILDKDDNPIPNGDLSTLKSGDPVSFQVDFDYAAVRWLPGPSWNGNSSQCRTVCRRE
jgi:Flp pilus assembly protein TadG